MKKNKKIKTEEDLKIWNEKTKEQMFK